MALEKARDGGFAADPPLNLNPERTSHVRLPHAGLNNPDATQIGMALVIALVFASGPVALAHDTAWPRAVTPTGATVGGFDVSRTAWPAPVGHRQPRAEDIPAEGPKNAMLILQFQRLDRGA
jgi:hypothetical protein